MEAELKSIGLSDKEVKVYLAVLELGQGTVQEISKKALIPRPTTHLVLEQLSKRGLISSHEYKNKRVLSAEFPERLLRLLDHNEQELKMQRTEIIKILPRLKSLYDQAREHPRVRFFEGKEGLKAMQEDFLRTKTTSILEIFPRDEYEELFTQEEREAYRRKFAKKKLRGKNLYTRKAGALKNYTSGVESRILTDKNGSVASDIIIYGNKVAFAVFRGKPIGIIIESKEIAETLRTLFALAWKN